MRRSQDTDYRPGGSPWTGRRMLLTMLAFFGVVIAVNLTMATLAVGNFPGLVVKSGFVASQDFNESRALLDAQAERGWKVEARAVERAPALFFRDAEGRPIAGLTVAAKAMRPTEGNMDADFAMVEAAPGLYVADAPLRPGRWRIAFTAEGVGPRFAATADLFISPGA